MKRILLIVTHIICLSIVSCTKDTIISETPINDTTTEIDRLSFASKEDLEIAIDNFVNGTTKGTVPTLRASLLNNTSHIDIENDPILSYDLRNTNLTKADINENIYEYAGYDKLIPDKNFASFLNVRAEIEVGNTIYKISPKGTYYFDKSLEDDFNNNYEIFEESEGIAIDSMTVQVKDGIYRYATFSTDSTFIFSAENNDMEDEWIEGNDDFIESANTKAQNNDSALKNLNYNDYPRYCSDAHTKVGIWLQKLFGRNKSYDYYFSKNRKFTSKFYYYDYVVVCSIGVETKMQKKSFLFWNWERAKEIYIGWKNIILATELKGNLLEYPAKADPKTKIITRKEYINGGQKDVAYVFGLYASQDDINKVIGLGIKNVLTAIKSKTNNDLSTADRLFIVGPKTIYTIFPSGGSSVVNQCGHEKQFYHEFTLGASFTLNNLKLSGNWANWVMSIAKTTYEMPNTRIVQGDICTAVNFNGEIGAMSIYKEKE